MANIGSEEPFRWSDASKTRRADFASLLEAPAFKDVFNDKFIDGLERRKDYLTSRSDKVQGIQLTILLVLAMALLSQHLSISFFGLSRGWRRRVDRRDGARRSVRA